MSRTQHFKKGPAYLLWGLCIFGCFGIHRFYLGRYFTGALYLFTFGLLFVGQFMDLALIPGMVDEKNRSLRGKGSYRPGKRLASKASVAELIKSLEPPKEKPMITLLKAARKNGGTLSAAEAALYTELAPEQVDKLLQVAMKHGYAEVGNDPKTGAVRYKFDFHNQ